MKATDVVGKRIIAIEQKRFYNTHLHRWEYDFHAIVLDDGSKIAFTAVETQESPAVDARLYTGENGHE